MSAAWYKGPGAAPELPPPAVQALGLHDGMIQMSSQSARGQVLQALTCHVSGSAQTVGKKKPLVGGLGKLPADFKEPAKFVEAGDALLSSLTAKPTFQRQQLWEKEETSKRCVGASQLLLD
jgi:hypothetical protein